MYMDKLSTDCANANSGIMSRTAIVIITVIMICNFYSAVHLSIFLFINAVVILMVRGIL